jgi:hypothetical protein
VSLNKHFSFPPYYTTVRDTKKGKGSQPLSTSNIKIVEFKCTNCRLQTCQVSTSNMPIVDFKHANCRLPTYQLSTSNIPIVDFQHTNCRLQTCQLLTSDIPIVDFKHTDCRLQTCQLSTSNIPTNMAIRCTFLRFFAQVVHIKHNNSV